MDRSTRRQAKWASHTQLAQWRVGNTTSNSPNGELDRPIQLAVWLVGWTTSNSPNGGLDQPNPARRWASWITLVQIRLCQMDQSRTMQSCLWNSFLRVLIKLSLVSSQSKLLLKLYDKNDEDLFSRISSNQSYKLIMVNLTPWLFLKTDVVLKAILSKEIVNTF